jgi:hypothetical protein
MDNAVFWLPSQAARLAVLCVGVRAVPALRALAMASMGWRRAWVWLLALDLAGDRA